MFLGKNVNVGKFVLVRDLAITFDRAVTAEYKSAALRANIHQRSGFTIDPWCIRSGFTFSSTMRKRSGQALASSWCIAPKLIMYLVGLGTLLLLTSSPLRYGKILSAF